MRMGGKNYDFFQFAYLYEMPFWSKVSIALEPFATSVNKPELGRGFAEKQLQGRELSGSSGWGGSGFSAAPSPSFLPMPAHFSLFS